MAEVIGYKVVCTPFGFDQIPDEDDGVFMKKNPEQLSPQIVQLVQTYAHGMSITWGLGNKAISQAEAAITGHRIMTNVHLFRFEVDGTVNQIKEK